MMKRLNNITWGIGVLLMAFILLPTTANAQMETQAGDMVLSAGASISDLSFGFNGSFQLNVTNKIAAHPSVNYNTYGDGSWLSADAWVGYHGLKNIPYLGSSAEGKENVDAYVMFGPTFYKDGSTGGDSGFAFGAGGGGRYYFNDNMAFTVEGKYRMLVGGNYAISWYEVGAGISLAL